MFNYGCVIWMADPYKKKGFSANYETLERAVNEYGISLIALTDYFKTDEVADLVGLNYENVKLTRLGGKRKKFVINGNHFVISKAAGLIFTDVRELAGSTIPDANGITVENTKYQKDMPVINTLSSTQKVKIPASLGPHKLEIKSK